MIKSPEIDIYDTLTSDSRLFHNREFKPADGPTFDFSMDTTVADGKEKINTSNCDNRVLFSQNLRYWIEQTKFLANNDFNNSYYRRIVDMGLDAVPFIVEELKKRPSFIVHALDEILPGVVEYGDGYIPVEKACKTWTSILTTTGSN